MQIPRVRAQDARAKAKAGISPAFTEKKENI